MKNNTNDSNDADNDDKADDDVQYDTTTLQMFLPCLYLTRPIIIIITTMFMVLSS